MTTPNALLQGYFASRAGGGRWKPPRNGLQWFKPILVGPLRGRPNSAGIRMHHRGFFFSYLRMLQLVSWQQLLEVQSLLSPKDRNYSPLSKLAQKGANSE